MSPLGGHGELPWRALTIAPTLAVLVVLTAAPLAMLVVMTAFDIQWVEGAARWTYVGAQHLADLPRDALFRAGVLNTALFAVVAVAGEMLLGFVLALLVGRVRRGRVIYRAVFLLPILVPGIVIGAIWQLMYNVDFGVINELTGLAGLPPLDWLGDKHLALLSVIAVDIWHWTPFCFLLLLAGLEALPQEVYEASRVDGASPIAQLRYVTLPLMMPSIMITLIFRLIVAVKVFDEVYLLTGGGPGTATEVVSFTIYRRFFTEDRTGLASVMSVATVLTIALLAILALAAARRRGATS